MAPPPMFADDATPVRMKDVAQAANVSVATVSRSLNNAGEIQPATRARVIAVAQKLGYRHNEIARSLKFRSTRTFGVLTDDLEGVFTMLILRGLEDAATAAGFNVFLCNTYGDDNRERQHLEALLAKQVDGLVLSSGFRVGQRGAPALPIGATPIVYAYQYTHEAPVHCIVPDDVGGGKIAVQHLIGVGRRRVGVIAGPMHYEASHLRLQGARTALAGAGLSLPASRVRQGQKWYEDVGYELASELLRARRPPDGLFCMSDNLAVGALGAAKDLGFAVPEDVSIVGFDGRYAGAHVRPPLTTVALPLYEIGQRAGDLLLQQIGGRPPRLKAPRVHRLPCQLVERGSSRPVTVTGAPAIDANDKSPSPGPAAGVDTGGVRRAQDRDS
jgi:LacI family transcriptional regulator